MSQAMSTDKSNSNNKSGSSANEKLSQALSMANKAKNQKMAEAREDISEVLHDTQERYEDLKAQAREVIETSQKSVEKNVEAHPYRFILGAGLFGLAIGYLMSKKS